MKGEPKIENLLCVEKKSEGGETLWSKGMLIRKHKMHWLPESELRLQYSTLRVNNRKDINKCHDIRWQLLWSNSLKHLPFKVLERVQAMWFKLPTACKTVISGTLLTEKAQKIGYRRFQSL
jgi:hypothetical protein